MRLAQCVVRAAVVAAGRTATIDGDVRRSWGEVHDRIGRAAAGLRALGIAPGDRVAVLAHNCDLYLEAYFAVSWAGAVLVPLNIRLAEAELAFQLADAGVRLLIHGREFAALVGSLCAGEGPMRLPLDPEVGAATFAALATGADWMPDTDVDDESIAGIFYTGGTTGLPKGVMLTHRNLHAMAANLLMQIPFGMDDVNFHSAPMFHLADIGILFATMAGGTHVFARGSDVEEMLSALSAHKVTHCFTVPAVIGRMVDSPSLETLDLSHLRLLGYGGSAMPSAVLALARTRFPGAEFVQGYGQTEFPAATILSPADHHPDADPALLRSCGRMCFGYDIRIQGPDGAELPRGAIGEIVGRGDNVMAGYWNRPEETAAALRGGWLHTGDLGYMDAGGYLYVVDRLKDMIVSGAENVYSIEVESALSWHPAIAESAVLGLPDPEWGERVHAVIVLKDGAEAPDRAALADFCAARIARYKIPKTITIRPSPLPRNAAGKIVKRALREELEQQMESRND